MNKLLIAIAFALINTTASAESDVEFKGEHGIINVMSSQASACIAHLADKLGEELDGEQFERTKTVINGTRRVIDSQTEMVVMTTIAYTVDRKPYTAFCNATLTGVHRAGVTLPSGRWGWAASQGWFDVPKK